MDHGYAVHGQDFEIGVHLLKHGNVLAVYEGRDGMHNIVSRDVWFAQQITGQEIYEVVTKGTKVLTAFGLPSIAAAKARAARNQWIKRK